MRLSTCLHFFASRNWRKYSSIFVFEFADIRLAVFLCFWFAKQSLSRWQALLFLQARVLVFYGISFCLGCFILNRCRKQWLFCTWENHLEKSLNFNTLFPTAVCWLWGWTFRRSWRCCRAAVRSRRWRRTRRGRRTCCRRRTRPRPGPKDIPSTRRSWTRRWATLRKTTLPTWRLCRRKFLRSRMSSELCRTCSP